MNEKKFQNKMNKLIDVLYSETNSSNLAWEKVEKSLYRHLVLSSNCSVDEGYITNFSIESIDKQIGIGLATRYVTIEENTEEVQNYFISFMDDNKAVDSYFDFEIVSMFEEPKLQNLLKAVRRKVNNIDDFLNGLA